jgi:hypothetical protein
VAAGPRSPAEGRRRGAGKRAGPEDIRATGPDLAGLLSDLNDDAMSVARVRKASRQPGSARLTPMGSMPDALIRASAISISVTRKLTWCGPAPRAARKRAGERRVRTPGGRQQLDFRACREFQLAH